jgi:predicted peroxiredoxin
MEAIMANGTDKLVIVVTKGIESELSSVAFIIANSGISAGLKVFIFLTSTGIDLVRKGGQTMTQVAPLDPLAALINDFQARGGVIWACPPCVKSRGYAQNDLLEGVIIAGASVMHAEIKSGAATLSF